MAHPPDPPLPGYAAWFDAEQYELVYRDRDTADAERLAELIERAVDPAPDDEILDVGTGRGRHALVLAARGHRVVGLDLAPRAVATARRRAAEAGLAGRARFVEGDMRALPFPDGAFDGVVNLFTSFGFFEDDRDHARAVAEMARVLRPPTAGRPGGWLVQDFLNAAYVRAHLVPEDVYVEAPEQAPGEAPAGIVVHQARRIVEDAPGGPRVEKTITLGPEGGGAPVVFVERVRLLERADFERYYAAAGLRVAEAFGAYDGRPPGPDTPRVILVAKRDAR
jgi:SAM-dependent methyltransferase